MTYEDLAKTNEFQALHPVKKNIIAEIMKNNQHAAPEVMLPKMLNINKELTKRGLSFTREETDLIIRIMKDNMSPAEQQKVDMLTGFFFK